MLDEFGRGVENGIPSVLEDEEDMASASDLTISVAKLEERVANHIKFFWSVVAVGFVCMGALALLVFNTRSTFTTVAKAEANAPGRIVQALLDKQYGSRVDAEANISAASSVLHSSKIGPVRPDRAELKVISERLTDIQQQYPDLAQVWETTGAFISYRSEALTPSAPEIYRHASGKPCVMTADSTIGGFSFQSCEATLDEIAEHIHGNTFGGRKEEFVFLNAVVHYHGGSLPDGLMKFYGCVFVIDSPVVPPPPGRRAMQLLAATDDLAHVAIVG